MIGLLPVPFETIKAMLPMVRDEGIKELLDYIKPAESENEAENEAVWTEQVLKDISELSGQIGMYIEMPLQYPFTQWKKNSNELLEYLNDAIKVTEAYIRCRSDRVEGIVSDSVLDDSFPTSFLPKPGLMK